MMSEDSLDRALSNLQCPFTWDMPDIDISKERFLKIQMEKRDSINKEEPYAEFNWRCYPLDVELAFEFFRLNNDIESGLRYAECAIEHVEQCLQSNCQETFFIDSKNALLHVALANKAYLLMTDHRTEEAESIVDRIMPLEKMDIKDKAAIHGIKAAVLIKYGAEGRKRAVGSALEASRLNPDHGGWHFLAGTAMGRLRRATFNKITYKEIEKIETAISLDEENPSYIVYLAQLYSEMATTLYYDRSQDNYDVNMADSRHFAEKAVDAFKKAVLLRPNCASFKARATHGFIRIKPMELVDKCFVKQLLDDILEKAPNHRLIYHDLGYYYDHFEYNYDKAIESLETAHGQDNYKAFIYLLVIKWKCRRRDEIMRDIEEGLEKYTWEDVQREVLVHAVVYTLLIEEDWNKALTYANKCLKLDPSGPFFVRLLSWKGGRVNVIQMMRDKLHNHTPKDIVTESDKFIQLSRSVDLSTCTPKNFDRWKREQEKIIYLTL